MHGATGRVEVVSFTGQLQYQCLVQLGRLLAVTVTSNGITGFPAFQMPWRVVNLELNGMFSRHLFPLRTQSLPCFHSQEMRMKIDPDSAKYQL